MVRKIKKQTTQKCVIKRKIKFGNYKKPLEATQLDNEIEYLENNKINSSILKPQQRFKNERQCFTEEINKIVLSLNDDKLIQSIDLIEIYAHGTSKDLISEKEKN